MPKIIQYKCDFPGCEQVRTESNHWFVAEVFPATKKFETGQIRIYPFKVEFLEIDPGKMSEGFILLCGEAHVQQFVSSNLHKLFPAKAKEVIDDEKYIYPSEEELKNYEGDRP